MVPRVSRAKMLPRPSYSVFLTWRYFTFRSGYSELYLPFELLVCCDTLAWIGYTVSVYGPRALPDAPTCSMFCGEIDRFITPASASIASTGWWSGQCWLDVACLRIRRIYLESFALENQLRDPIFAC
jgi:hypothetical protein